MALTSSEYLIVKLPYFTNRRMLPSTGTKRSLKLDGNATGVGDIPPRQIIEFDSARYRTVIRNSLMERDSSGRPLGASVHTYVYPKPPSHDRDELVEHYLAELTDYPVIYIIYIDQDSQGHATPAGWLKGCLGDTDEDSFDIYKSRYVVYVGETIDIERRTVEHLAGNRLSGGNADSGELETEQQVPNQRERQRVDKVIRQAEKSGIEVKQYVIWQKHFTKSMTLDIEDRLIDYLHASSSVFMLNGRGNPQGHYYESNQRDQIFSNVWQKLSHDKAELFPPEEAIWNSGLYKVSPFHSLGEEQSRAVLEICENAKEFVEADDLPLAIDSHLSGCPTKESRLILVSGASGTGKSIVLSRLFLDLSQQMRADEKGNEDSLADIQPTSRVCLVVNNPQQFKLYADLAKKLGLQRTKKDECVYTATRFLNQVTSQKRPRPDIVLVYEAHLLFTRANQGYTKKYHGNQLYDLLLNAKVVIAVMDQEQVMRRRQSIPHELVSMLVDEPAGDEEGELSDAQLLTLRSTGDATRGMDSFRCYRVELKEQFRIAASGTTLAWIDRLADTEKVGILPIPKDDVELHEGKHGIDDCPYDIRVFTSPNALFKAIDARAEELQQKATVRSSDREGKHTTREQSPLCRVVATYDWDYKPKTFQGHVRLYRTLNSKGETVWRMPDGDGAPTGALPGTDNVFDHPWNMALRGKDSNEVWSADPNTQEEVGSYFTIQGFDLNYVGVIIGPSVIYRDGHIVFDGEALKDSDVSGSDADAFARRQFKILIRRGIHGLYLFAVDPELQRALCDSARAAGKLDLSV